MHINRKQLQTRCNITANKISLLSHMKIKLFVHQYDNAVPIQSLLVRKSRTVQISAIYITNMLHTNVTTSTRENFYKCINIKARI